MKAPPPKGHGLNGYDEHWMCKRPDRDAPRLKCGYPFPCPHHTAVIDMEDLFAAIDAKRRGEPTPSVDDRRRFDKGAKEVPDG